MFTGLVEEMGRVRRIDVTPDRCDLEVEAQTVLEGVRFGDSINVNGVCLSVMSFDTAAFVVGLAPETRRLTALEALTTGDPVNLERAVLPTTRLGGHYVQGHVDGTGTIRSIEPDGDSLMIEIACDPALMPYIVRKGYVAIDGTSLTVVETHADGFSLTLIRHSRPLVVLGAKSVGDRVNIEVDIMAKYAEKIINAGRL